MRYHNLLATYPAPYIIPIDGEDEILPVNGGALPVVSVLEPDYYRPPVISALLPDPVIISQAIAIESSYAEKISNISPSLSVPAVVYPVESVTPTLVLAQKDVTSIVGSVYQDPALISGTPISAEEGTEGNVLGDDTEEPVATVFDQVMEKSGAVTVPAAKVPANVIAGIDNKTVIYIALAIAAAGLLTMIFKN
jgi:hypothetical protein